jgi:hypothetical protein
VPVSCDCPHYSAGCAALGDTELRLLKRFIGETKLEAQTYDPPLSATARLLPGLLRPFDTMPAHQDLHWHTQAPKPHARE